MKQTAIDWLKKELEAYGSPSHLNLDWTTFDQLCEQAKQMEKEQIKNAYYTGGDDVEDNRDREAEQYYNETFKSE